jgi:hypothetical protein
MPRLNNFRVVEPKSSGTSVANTIVSNATGTGMIKYLLERNCPKCSGEFVVVLLGRTPWMQSINGFCRDCDYCIEWKLIRKKTFPAHQTTERKAFML